MGRRAPGKSLNSSMVSNGNISVAEDTDAAVEHAEFIKRFRNKVDCPARLSVEKLIGNEKPLAELKERFEALFSPDIEDLYNVLLVGPQGTGKTTILNKLVEQYTSGNTKEGRQPVSYFHLEARWTLWKNFGNPEVRLVALFDEALLKQPSVIFINRIDRICTEKRSQAEDRVFDVLSDQMEHLSRSQARVMVIAETREPEKLSPSLRSADWNEIGFSLPTEQMRLEYLNSLFDKIKSKDLSDQQMEEIAKRSHCYTFRDLQKFYSVAKKTCGEQVLDYFILEKTLKQLKPAAVKSITTPCPTVHWNDIGGYELVKEELKESVISRIKHKEMFQKICGDTEKGALLYGPPGCSKTMLARALATESGFNFISIRGPEFNSKYVGDTEASVRRLYRNAREIAPCIIFFDEIDGFASERSDNQSSSVNHKVVTTLLVELTNLDPQEHVYTIAATNRPEMIDSALLRPGRLNPAIYIPLPSEADRRAIFRVHLPPISPVTKEVFEHSLDQLVAKTAGYSGSEIQLVCQIAGKLALRDNSYDIDYVSWNYLFDACEMVQPKMSPDSLAVYEKFQKKHGDVLSRPNRNKSSENNIQRGTLNRLMRSLSINKKMNKDQRGNEV